jgi:hypothetical protein
MDIVEQSALPKLNDTKNRLRAMDVGALTTLRTVVITDQ